MTDGATTAQRRSKIELAQALLAGQPVDYREHGNSMLPIVKSGALIHAEPLISGGVARRPEVGDVVFCKVQGRFFTHKVTAVRGARANVQFQISNNRGHINGWVGLSGIFGVVTMADGCLVPSSLSRLR